MSPRNVKLLHVEDDPTHRLLVARHLTVLPEYAFAITRVASEAAAVAEFGRGGTDLVLLDYQLLQGNGLSCLRKLRQLDPVVAIVAISGVATPEIASELLQSGADDYLSKHDLTAERLADSVRRALARGEARRQGKPVPAAGGGDPAGVLQQIYELLAAGPGTEFVRLLDQAEAAARRAGSTAEQLEEVLGSVCGQVDAARPADGLPAEPLLRPVLLELLFRLFGQVPLPEDNARHRGPS